MGIKDAAEASRQLFFFFLASWHGASNLTVLHFKFLISVETRIPPFLTYTIQIINALYIHLCSCGLYDMSDPSNEKKVYLPASSYTQYL